MTFILLWLISRIPGLEFRSSEEQELQGGDLGEMGEVDMAEIVQIQEENEKRYGDNVELGTMELGDSDHVAPEAPKSETRTVVI